MFLQGATKPFDLLVAYLENLVLDIFENSINRIDFSEEFYGYL
jgi:hypothetical protein